MIFIDTGHLVALLNPRDALHDRASAWSGFLRGRRLLVTEYVVIEAVNFFRAPGRRNRAEAIVRLLRNTPAVEFVNAGAEWFDAGWKLFRTRPDKEWSLTDCISFCVMEERGIREALAHDEHFEQAGFVALLRRSPSP